MRVSLKKMVSKFTRVSFIGFHQFTTPAFIPEDFMEAEGDESDDAGHGDMRNLHLNDDPDQFADD